MSRLTILLTAVLLVACSREEEAPRVTIDGEGTPAERMEIGLEVARQLNTPASSTGAGRVGDAKSGPGDMAYYAGYSKQRFLFFEETVQVYVGCEIRDDTRRAALRRECVDRIRAALAAYRGNASRSDTAR